MSEFEIQNLIDEYKEQMPDDLYLKLSNINMKTRSNTKSMYKAIYLVPTFKPQRNTDIYKMTIESEKRIIEMTQEQYEDAQRNIEYVLSGKLNVFVTQNNNRIIEPYNIVEECIDNDEHDDGCGCISPKINSYKKIFLYIENNEYLISLKKLDN